MTAILVISKTQNCHFPLLKFLIVTLSAYFQFESWYINAPLMQVRY